MSQITIQFNKPDAAQRLGINVANMAEFAAKGTATQYVRGELYAASLGTLPEGLTQDELLSINGEKSQHPGSAGEPVRNILKLNSESEGVEITFVDVGINVSQAHTIKETPLTKRRGTVKEYIQAQDYAISVTGSLISNTQNGFPYQMLRVFDQVMRTPDTLNVASKYLEAFDISQVVVKEVKYMQQRQKHVNQLPFTITLISDEDYELEME